MYSTRHCWFHWVWTLIMKINRLLCTAGVAGRTSERRLPSGGFDLQQRLIFKVQAVSAFIRLNHRFSADTGGCLLSTAYAWIREFYEGKFLSEEILEAEPHPDQSRQRNTAEEMSWSQNKKCERKISVMEKVKSAHSVWLVTWWLTQGRTMSPLWCHSRLLVDLSYLWKVQQGVSWKLGSDWLIYWSELEWDHYNRNPGRFWSNSWCQTGWNPVWWCNSFWRRRIGNDE